ncbi:unnamed protein product [Arctia plantaginis]|uniref:C-type lectin domain-containing protein n=1 Tax=Arctia plantaginis TaxID=874455 RepID=A0A8S0ZMZ9_ARCPL|nr:unnamed protein product [Arctia plantaginis]
MCSKILFMVLTLYFISNFSNGQRDKKFFRTDYHYIESTQSFYKFHTLHRPWRSAKRTCALESAELFYPVDNKEAQVLLTLWTIIQPFDDAYVGISDLLAKGTFQTIHGNLIDDVYHNWSPGEPNDADGNEDCVIMRQDGTYNDIPCFISKPFICKKSLVSLEWNKECNMPNLDYKLNKKLGRCYKFHMKPQDWSGANGVCSYEKSYLAVINSKQEADFLAILTESMPKKKFNEDFMPGVVLLGFHDRYEEGWETVKGTSLEDSGYMNWAKGQPDDPPRGAEDRCGSMLYNGQLSDIPCDKRGFFICEHEVAQPASDFDHRSGDRKR